VASLSSGAAELLGRKDFRARAQEASPVAYAGKILNRFKKGSGEFASDLSITKEDLGCPVKFSLLF
jgi:hypothetical protein